MAIFMYYAAGMLFGILLLGSAQQGDVISSLVNALLVGFYQTLAERALKRRREQK